jgi:hypothetical protein
MWAGVISLASAQNVTVSIGSGSAAKNENVTVPLMISDVTNLGSAKVTLTFNESVVNVTAVSDSQFDQPPNLFTRGPGWVLLQAGQFMTGLDGDVLMCNVTLEAVGAEGDTSPLNLTDIALEDMAMTPIAVDVVSNGTFSILDETAPVVTNPSADPTIISDAAVIYGATESRLNVTVTDNSSIALVTIDLTSIGEPATAPMINVPGTDIYTLTTTASIAGVHSLPVNATDAWGNSNISVNIPLTVVSPAVLTIEDNINVAPSGTVVTPIMINGISFDAAVAVVNINLAYNSSVVHVTAIGDSAFDFCDSNIDNVTGITTIGAMQMANPPLSGDVQLCNVTFEAVGPVEATSTLNLSISELVTEGPPPVKIPANVDNGSIKVGEVDPPEVTDASANPSVIPNDTDDDPKWGETSVLNVTVTDESNIVSVTIDLSAIGGSAVQQMANIVGDIWSVETNATGGTAPGTYDLQINATDEYGNSNTTESISLRVQKNGDVQPYNGDGTVDFVHDGLYLVRHTLNVPGYGDIRDNIADVTGDGTIDFVHDGLYLVRNTLNVPGYEILH